MKGASPAIPLTLVLETPRCRLRSVTQDDIPHVWSATRFAGFNNGLAWDAPRDPAALQAAHTRTIQSWQSGTGFVFTAESKRDGAFLGRVGISPPQQDEAYKLGFWTHPLHQGQGFATECVAAALHFAFEILLADRIGAAHAMWNHASRRVIEKSGLVFVGENPCGFMKNGSCVAEREYLLTRAEWQARCAEHVEAKDGDG